MNGDRVAVDPACFEHERLKLPETKRRYLRNLAERTTAGGLLIYNPASASYIANAELLAGCTTPAPTEAAVEAVERSKPRPPEPVPYAEWPAWAKGVAALRTAEDVGVGDTIKRRLSIAGTLFEATMKALGVPCKCPARRAAFNVSFAYSLIPAAG